MTFATGETPYWDESTCYRFRVREVEEIERVTREIHSLCLQTVSHIVTEHRYAELHIPPPVIPLIERSWTGRHPTLYGRMDFRFDGESPPKLLEYNADTPTTLFESAVVQWDWAESCGIDQSNRVDAALRARWAELAGDLPHHLHFACLDDAEDLLTVSYLSRVASAMGFECSQLTMDRIGWSDSSGQFVGIDGESIEAIFKLYPWEWMWLDSFADALPVAQTRWIEPPWKMLISNKGFLKILWERNRGHPNLLRTSDRPDSMTSYARKPLLSREGNNITLIEEGRTLASNSGSYGNEGYVYQELAPLPSFDGGHPVIGSWIVGETPCGIGVREANGLITDNSSRFVPHWIE